MKLTSDMHAIRQFIGVCPQHDVLFSSLTVSEHLRFYGELKCPSLSPPDLEDKISLLISEVGLTEKVNAPSSSLSGGQKRKLSLAIALIGEGKVVILDEPTSGMDPYLLRGESVYKPTKLRLPGSAQKSDKRFRSTRNSNFRPFCGV
jgi:ATP-binding cassette subfamily A (ABC1) protein 3